MDEEDLALTMNRVLRPVVQEVMHMGILRSADTQETAVIENILKARAQLFKANDAVS